jgi:aromatic-L-amino-acid decarboxylase
MSQAMDHPSENASGDAWTEPRGTLDPKDWDGFRTQAHAMLDYMVDYIRNIRERPVWQPIPDEVRARFLTGVPREPNDLARVHEEFLRDVLPYAVGNVHPGFMGWVHGGGTPVGLLAEMLAAGLNANLGGRDQTPVEVERQIGQWTREIFGFPDSATGLFVTGTSMANLIAVTVARDVALGFAVRRRGLGAETKRLTAYASTAVHGCIRKALDISGVGSNALRLVVTDARYRIDLEALEQAIRTDCAAGFTPFLVVGTAGTVDTGAIDNLSALADLCRRQNVWFHVDGACGSIAMLAPDLAPRLAGIERADSLAFDFHKWAQVPYDAGYILVRDGQAHKNAFISAAAYLLRAERGLAAGSPWPCDFGPDLSRGFRALKAWFTLKVYGTDALGSVISKTCALARYLEDRIMAAPELELMAPMELNIVCFRYRAEEPDLLNQNIVIALQESGVVAPSTTVLGGRTVIRAAIVNHRTGRGEIDALVDGTLRRGRTLQRSARRPEQALQAPAPALYKSSLQNAERQLASPPHSADLLFQRANLLNQMGRSAEARDAYLELLKIEPEHLGFLNNLGQLLVATGKKIAARTVYTVAVAKHRDDVAARVNFASLLIQAGEPGAARERLEHALKVDPSCRQAHAGMAFALEALKNGDRATWHRRAAFHGLCVLPSPIVAQLRR